MTQQQSSREPRLLVSFMSMFVLYEGEMPVEKLLRRLDASFFSSFWSFGFRFKFASLKGAVPVAVDRTTSHAE